jgi:hypothetical protein
MEDDLSGGVFVPDCEAWEEELAPVPVEPVPELVPDPVAAGVAPDELDTAVA